MSHVVELHSRALADLDAMVSRIGPRDWQQRTACTDWTVRDLLNHLTAEALWAPHLLRGETLEQVGDRYQGDVLGADPLTTWREASAGEHAAVTAPGALEVTVHTTMGPLEARTYLSQRLTDLAVHRWDLAQGLGVETTIPTDVAEHLLELIEPMADELADTGLFAPPVEVPADASSSERLLGLLGRRP